MNGHDGLLSDAAVVLGEGGAPEITVTKSARFDELENTWYLFC